MRTLPTDPLDLAILLHGHLQQMQIHARTVTGILPSDFDFHEVESALNSVQLLVSSSEAERKIEYALPNNFFLSLDELVSTRERRAKAPARFYLADSDYLYKDEDGKNVAILQVEHYLAATQFYELLGSSADYKAGMGSARTLVFLQNEKLEVTPDYAASDLKDLSKISNFKDEFVLSETHKDQKRIITRTVLIEMFKERSRVQFSEVLSRFSEFFDKIVGSYQLYVSEFSFQKVKAEIEKEKLEATTKLNKVFADIQNQLLAVPAALILVGGQMENTSKWSSKNIVIWLGCLVFAALMNLLVRNQRHTLNAVQQEIDQQWLQIKGKYHSVADRFESSYKQLNDRYRHQIWLIRIVSLLVAISLGVSTGMLLWFSSPVESIWIPVIWGSAAAVPLIGWDVFQFFMRRKKAHIAGSPKK